MSLTSTLFRNVTAGPVVVAAVVTLLMWNRVPGPRAAQIAARVAMLLAGQLLAAVAVLAAINIAAGGLVVSVQDLLGHQSIMGATFSGQSGKVTLHPVATASSRTLTSAQRFTKAGYGGFMKTTLKGVESGITSTVYVWLPPQYAKNPGKQYPVLELLHGVPDSPGAWMAQMHLAKRMTAAVESGKSHPFILVVPEVTPFSSHSSEWDNEECTDVSSNDKIETWLTSDVRQMVLDDFRSIGSASGWGLMGYSTGGFCAAKLVVKNPDLYKAAVSISGYYVPESPLLTGNTTLSNENSPQRLLGKTTTPAASLLMTASSEDPIDPPSEAQALLAAAEANPGSKATEVQTFIAPKGGGHNQSAWEKMLPTAFWWISQRLSGPVVWRTAT